MAQGLQGGQTLNDRILAAKHSLAGQGLAKAVCKATTEELIGPKKKHLDCTYTWIPIQTSLIQDIKHEIFYLPSVLFHIYLVVLSTVLCKETCLSAKYYTLELQNLMQF